MWTTQAEEEGVLTDAERIKQLETKNVELRTKSDALAETLRLIACGKRPDGTYNRCRESCEQIAKDALDAYGKGE